jgi:hypothetical protein
MSSQSKRFRIEVILKLKAGLQDLFKTAILDDAVSDNSKRIFALQEEYIKTIDPVIRFLQGKNLHSKSAKKIICLKLLVFLNWRNSTGLSVPWEHRTKPSIWLLVPRRYFRFYCGMCRC